MGRHRCHLKVSLMALIWKCNQRRQNQSGAQGDQRLHGCGDPASSRGWNQSVDGRGSPRRANVRSIGYRRIAVRPIHHTNPQNAATRVSATLRSAPDGRKLCAVETKRIEIFGGFQDEARLHHRSHLGL
jgi:hypothetical protein